MRLIKLLIAEMPFAFFGAILAGAAGGTTLAMAVASINTLIRTDEWRSFGSSQVFLTYCSLAMLVGAMTFLSGSAISWLMQRRMANLRLSLCRRVLESRLARLEAIGQASVIELLVEDLNRLALGAHALPILVVNGTVCLAVLSYMALLNTVLFSIVVFAEVASLTVMWLILRRYQAAIDTAQLPRQRLMEHFHLLTGAIKEFKQSRALRTAFVELLYQPNVDAVRRSANRINGLGVGMDAIAKIGFLLSIGLLLFVVAARPSLATPDQLRSVILAFMFLVTPLATLLGNIPQLFEANASLLKIDRFRIDPDVACVEHLTAEAVEIGLSAVTHNYRDGAASGFALGPVTLAIALGEIVMLTGGNGSGKTTVAKLLAALYRPVQGVQAINGIGLEVSQTDTLRELVGAIWSDNTQTRHYLLETPTALEIGRNAWTLFGLDHVAPFGGGWVDCSAMSTGQRRRVALVSLLTCQRPFLIFDEWAANQDRHFRELFYNHLLPELRERGHGVLVIAHDGECHTCVDRIVEMHEGQILQVTLGQRHPIRNPTASNLDYRLDYVGTPANKGCTA